MTPKTLVTIVTYNERENLPDLVEEVFRVAATSPQVGELDILVVDDNSPDGTGKWCDEKIATEPRLHCIHRAGKLGLGSASITALKYGIEQQYDYLVNLDADFSHPPKHIPDLLAMLTGDSAVDVAIASRYTPGGGVINWPWKRRLLSRAINCYARFFLRLKPKDCSSSFRAYRVESLVKVRFEKFLSQGYSYLEELLWHLRRTGATMRETPYIFCDREKGVSKINKKEAAAALWILFWLGVTAPLRD